MNIIEVKDLSRRFKDFKAVDGISFNVKKGEIFGFLGPNGAGKSTTISMLATLLLVSEGEATINNFSVISQRDDVRRSIGLVFQDPSLDDRLTAEENLWFHSQLYGVAKKDYQKRYKEVLEMVDLWDRKDDFVKNFSGGMKRRLEIARGLIHYPAVLFLDEPTIGLDPQTRAHLWEYILKLKKEKQMTIFLTTHYMNEAEYCDHIAVIDHGKLIALDTPANLKKALGGDIIVVKSKNNQELEKEIAKMDNVKIKQKNGSLYLEVADGESFLPRLFKAVKFPIETVEMRKPTMDDVFLHLTGRTIREEEVSNKDRFRNEMKMRRRN